MKKGILILLLVIIGLNMSYSQTRDDFQKEMDLLFGELEKTMQQFAPLFNGELEKQLDTLDLKKFGLDLEQLEKQFEGKNLDNLSLSEIRDIMQIQMEMMENLDLSQFNEFFKQFGFETPKAPHNTPNEDDPKEEKSSGKKKRKVYKL